MEIFFLVGAVAACFLGYKTGNQTGIDSTLAFQRRRVQDRMAPNSAFERIYGVPGLYLVDINPELEPMPLVVISAASFMDLIARKKLSADEVTQEEIEGLRRRLVNDHLREKDVSVETRLLLHRLDS